jgi:hypothetical protein
VLRSHPGRIEDGLSSRGKGWRDPQGNLWNIDRLHKDHWDVSDSKGNKIREVDFQGVQIWPGGPKNRIKKGT